MTQFPLRPREGTVDLVGLGFAFDGIPVLKPDCGRGGKLVHPIGLNQEQTAAVSAPDQLSHAAFSIIPPVEKPTDTAILVFGSGIILSDDRKVLH